MQVVINTKGQARGKVCLKKTLLTMEINDIWTVSEDSFNSLPYLRYVASLLNRKNKMIFSIDAKKANGGIITIKRIE